MKGYILIGCMFLTVQVQAVELSTMLERMKHASAQDLVVLWGQLSSLDQQNIKLFLLDKYNGQIINSIKVHMLSGDRIEAWKKALLDQDVPPMFVRIVFELPLSDSNGALDAKISAIFKKIEESFGKELMQAFNYVADNFDKYYRLLKKHIQENHIASIEEFLKRNDWIAKLNALLDKSQGAPLPKICTAESICANAIKARLLLMEQDDQRQSELRDYRHPLIA